MEIDRMLPILLVAFIVGIIFGHFCSYSTGYNRGWVDGAYDTKERLEAPLDTAKMQYEQMYNDNTSVIF